MFKIVTVLLALIFSIVSSYAQELKSQINDYFDVGNSQEIDTSFIRNNIFQPDDSNSKFMKKGNVLNITDTLDLSTKIGTANMITSATDSSLQESKFYTQETRVTEKLFQDKLELYGGAVLGASADAFGSGNIQNTSSGLQTFASTVGGAKYNLSDGFSLILENRYNVSNKMAGDMTINPVSESNSVKTGVVWSF